MEIASALKEGLTHPEDYFGSVIDLQDQGWAQTFGRHRDSDLLQQSNFDTILDMFREKFELMEDWRIEGASHWLVGWYDHLMVRALQCKCEDWEDAYFVHIEGYPNYFCETCKSDGEVRPIFLEALEIRARLEDYPVLDEEDWSRREWEELEEYLDNEISSVYRRLDVVELNDEGYEDMKQHILQDVSDYTSTVDGVGDITDIVREAYIKVLLSDALWVQEMRLEVE